MTEPDITGRDRILSRIRDALRISAPKQEAGGLRGRIFPLVADPLDRFQKECASNITECIVVPDARASAAAVASLLDSVPAREIFVQDAPELRRMEAQWRTGCTVRWSSEGGPLESSEVTITLAEVLVAQTGSIFVSAACGGRGASVTAPVHVVVASLKQLVPDLEAAFARLRECQVPTKNSFFCLITGSSRTADIEKILVMGAHGPRRLVVVLALGTD